MSCSCSPKTCCVHLRDTHWGESQTLGSRSPVREIMELVLFPFFRWRKLRPHSGEELTVNPKRSWQGPLALGARFFHSPSQKRVRRRNRGHGRGLATLDLLQVQKGPENFHFIKAFSCVESMKKYPHRIGEVMWCFRCLTDQTHA